MRLTLRTLLAYMDDILDPSDHELLGRKIESSDFATELIHRTRDVVRRLRLGAPEPLAADDDLHGGDVDLDANLVAEYLDNTVDPEHVADFERGCLEAGSQADMQLAEVASCHHILTMVLGEPAEVDDDLRRRLYALEPVPVATRLQIDEQQVRIESAHLASNRPAPSDSPPAGEPVSEFATSAGISSVVAAAGLAAEPQIVSAVGTQPRSVGEPAPSAVPEYLLETRRKQQRSRRLLAAALLGTVIGGALVFRFWPTAQPQLPAEMAQRAAVEDLDVAVPPLGLEPAEGVPGVPPVIHSGGGDSGGGEPGGGEAPAWTPSQGAASRGGEAPAWPPAQQSAAEAASSEAADTQSAAADSVREQPSPVEQSMAEGRSPNESVGDVEASWEASEQGDPAGITVDPAGLASADTAPPTAQSPAPELPRSETETETEIPSLQLSAGDDPLAPAGLGDDRAGESRRSGPATAEAANAGQGWPELSVPPLDVPGIFTPGATQDSSDQNSVPRPADLRPNGNGVPTTSIPALDLGLPEATDAPSNFPPTSDEQASRREMGTAPGDAEASSEADANASAAPSAAERNVDPTPIGSYLGNRDVLLRWDDGRGGWIRLGPRTALLPGDKLLSLPTFRTHIVLADANVYLGGGTKVELREGGSQGTVDIRLQAGRVIVNAGLNGNRLRVESGGQERELELAASSSLAVESRREFVPGRRQPLAEPSLEWYLTSGSCDVVDPDAGFAAQAPAYWNTAVGIDSPVEALDTLPEWIDSEQTSVLERRAQTTLEQVLENGAPVNIRLLELYDPDSRGRRIEDRTLAAESASYVGLFEPLIKALGDVEQRSKWKSHIQTIRAALARDAGAEEQVREALVALRGDKPADDLMAMLIGFDRKAVGTTREEMATGALVDLIGWLDHEQLDYRVLAVHNLNELTGTSNLGGYRPEHTSRQRQRAMRYYRDRLEKGDLGPREK